MHLITSCPCSIYLFVLLSSSLSSLWALPAIYAPLCLSVLPSLSSFLHPFRGTGLTVAAAVDYESPEKFPAPLFLRKVGILINFCRSCSLNLYTCSPDSPLSQLLQLSDHERVPDPWSSTFQESQVTAKKKDGCCPQSSWNCKSSIGSRQR